MQIKKNYKSELEVAKTFYEIFKIIHKAPLKNREIDVLAYISAYGYDMEDMCKNLNTTEYTIHNCMVKLRKTGFVTKDRKLTPLLKLDFSNLNLDISLGKNT